MNIFGFIAQGFFPSLLIYIFFEHRLNFERDFFSENNNFLIFSCWTRMDYIKKKDYINLISHSYLLHFWELFRANFSPIGGILNFLDFLFNGYKHFFNYIFCLLVKATFFYFMLEKHIQFYHHGFFTRNFIWTSQ